MLPFRCVQVHSQKTVVIHKGWFLGLKETGSLWDTALFRNRNWGTKATIIFLIFFSFCIRSITYCPLTHIHPWPLQYFSSSIANKSRSVPKYLDCRRIFSSGWNLKTCNLQLRSKTFKTYHHPVKSSLKLCFNSVHPCILNKLSVYKNLLIPIHTRTLVF